MISRKLLLAAVLLFFSCKQTTKEQRTTSTIAMKVPWHKETYRPQFHFSPKEHWMNDPNGLVYHKGLYHLFYQYYPDDTVWGPMHWGHATSKNLWHWEHQPIALYPDEHGFIFSGSAVVDEKNTSGFGTRAHPPLVAIYTYHSMEGEKAKRTDFQTQGIAYSLDNGASWTKYSGNPVIGNKGIRDFRDPKVFWHAESESWILTLVAGDHAKFYRSENLISWEYLSDFGKHQGAHGGVWECPDLFPLTNPKTGETKWILLISINPGAPNGGSGTQYFIGNFDGTYFSSDQKDEKWIDWGTDNYAGVTYNNLPNNDRVFIGWMSNWDYARDTPTEHWRSAMTLARKLELTSINGEYAITNYPLDQVTSPLEPLHTKTITVASGMKEVMPVDKLQQSVIRFKTKSSNFSVQLRNTIGEKVVLHWNTEHKLFTLDRSLSGRTDFSATFGEKHSAEVASLPEDLYEVLIVIDWSSIEVFLNKGQYAMTDQIFPTEPYSFIEIMNEDDTLLELQDFVISPMQSIW